MGQSPTGEPPVQRRGTNSRHSKAKRENRESDRITRANHRYQIAKFYVENLADRSFRKAVPVVKEEVESGRFPRETAPSYSTLWRWVETWREAENEGRAPSIWDFMEEDRSGRSRKRLDPELKEWLEDQVLEGTIQSVSRLYREAVRKAEQDEEDWTAPSKWQVRRFVEEMSVKDRSAARHGRNAALVDAMPKSTIPTDRPHDIWMIDEVRAPVHIRDVDPHTQELVSVKPWVVLVMDVESRLILSYHVVAPYQYGSDASYRHRDVLGALLGAAMPDLAPEETRDFAGFLPDEVRWDRHSTHEKLREKLIEAGVHVPETVGEKPHRQGRIEKANDLVKNLCETIHGAAHRYEPVGEGEVEVHPKQQRREGAGEVDRVRKKRPVHVADLLHVEEFREEFGKRVEQYNQHPHSFLDGSSPIEWYRRFLDRQETRPGRDAIVLMDNKVLTCTTAGIDHQVGGRRVRFAAESNGVEIEVGEQVHCYVDPLQRRLFAEYGGRLMALLPVEEWAERHDPETYVRRQRRDVAAASEYADDLHQRQLEREAGPTAHERAKAALEEETGEAEREEGVPPKEQGVVAHKRAKIEQERTRQAEEAPPPEETQAENEEDEDQEDRSSRPRGLATDPRDELQTKEAS